MRSRSPSPSNDVSQRGGRACNRDLGRAEGALEANTVTVEQIVAVPHVRQFARELDATLADAEKQDDTVALRGILMHVRERLNSFVEGLTGAAPVTSHEAKAQVNELNAKLEKKRREEETLAQEISSLRKSISTAREAGFAAQRDVVELEGHIRTAQPLFQLFRTPRAPMSLRLRAAF